MMAPTFREPMASDVTTIARNMRAIDAVECAEIAGLSPIDALCEAVRDSAFVLVACVDGAPMCAFGVAPEAILGSVGIPWLLGVDGLERHSRDILRFSRPAVRHMLSLYPHLKNVVHSDNRAAIRWLTWCGFKIGEAAPMGRTGAMFRPFDLKAA
jgi:hypothetical protein